MKCFESISARACLTCTIAGAIVILGVPLLFSKHTGDLLASIPLKQTWSRELTLKQILQAWRFSRGIPRGVLDGDVTSVKGTTGPGVPIAMRSWLQTTGVAIEENALTHFGSAAAVETMEKKCGWDPATSAFKDKECLSYFEFTTEVPAFEADPSEIDIVIPSIRNLDFLNDWREFFQGFHVIIVQDGDPDKFLEIPDWVDYELYNRRDIEAAVGDKAWSFSKRDASIRNFGFLVSRKKYVYTIDDDCLPALDNEGFKINPLAMHLRNLKTPSIPYFFNTLFDPYADGADFVRGYPYSLRGGVQTALSHGLWLNAPDYDAPTQLLKVAERNTRLVDTAMTIPAGVMFPMCSMNVAFDRLLIGPAFMQGLMGDGQPWARYDDMFAGWASKVVADHLAMGVKSGNPYIRHNKASNPFTNLKKEYKGLWWQEIVIPTVRNVKFSEQAQDAETCYRELAAHIRKELAPLHEYFVRLGNAMDAWVDLWEGAKRGTITFTPSRKFASTMPTINVRPRSSTKTALPVSREAPQSPALQSIESAALIGTNTSVMSIKGTTGPGVPKAMQSWLKTTGIPIEDGAQTYFGSAKAVENMEQKCGWDPATSGFKDKHCTDTFAFTTLGPAFVADPKEIDIVIPSIRNLDFLNNWREFFQGFHVIIVQDGDPDKFLEIPDWVDYELYNRRDIEAVAGEKAWSFSKRDASIRNFGFLVSKKKYVYTIDDDCLPALDNEGFLINPLAMHTRNLKTPSIPYFWNTLYDPYADGADFVRGYPYSLRGGVQTALSHGLWLNAPDYDAPTQLLKVAERNTRLVDTAVTIPAGTLYPMCSMNVAFDRALIGPAFMQGLMGDGQPWARYDDMFAGWASKVVADHLGMGVKSGQPYIRHNKASNPFTNLKKEYKGLWWQDRVIPTLQKVKFSSRALDAQTCYRELAAHIRTELAPLHEYFVRLAGAMEAWVDLWEAANSGKLKFVPNRKHEVTMPTLNVGPRSHKPASTTTAITR